MAIETVQARQTELRCFVISPPTAHVANVCYWHVGDIAHVLANVRFLGKNGRGVDEPPCRIMTQLGHGRSIWL